MAKTTKTKTKVEETPATFEKSTTDFFTTGKAQVRFSLHVKVKKLHPQAKMPFHAHDTDAGWDLYTIEKVRLATNNIIKIRTGLAFEIPEGWEMVVAEKSGFSSSNTAFLKAGTIDCDYRGEVSVVMQNAGDVPIVIEPGTKFVQVKFRQVPIVTMEETDTLNETERGEKGFGSSDKEGE